MKILKADREAAAMFSVSAYSVAKASELYELADSNHPLAEQARRNFDAVSAGRMSLHEACKVVRRAKGNTGTKLLSAQIRADLVDALHDYARRHKQLFMSVVEEAVSLLLAVEEA